MTCVSDCGAEDAVNGKCACSNSYASPNGKVCVPDCGVADAPSTKGTKCDCSNFYISVNGITCVDVCHDGDTTHGTGEQCECDNEFNIVSTDGLYCVKSCSSIISSVESG